MSQKWDARLKWVKLYHLACINTEFSELFSLKSIYVKYENASFAHERIRHVVKYFPRYLITTAKHADKIEPIKYLGKYLPICPIISCAKEPIYM